MLVVFVNQVGSRFGAQVATLYAALVLHETLEKNHVVNVSDGTFVLPFDFCRSSSRH